jgi:hypothetical protein
MTAATAPSGAGAGGAGASLSGRPRAAAPCRADDDRVDNRGDDRVLLAAIERVPVGAQSFSVSDVAVEHAGTGHLAQLVELAAAYGNRELSMDELRAARKPIEQRLTNARKQLTTPTRADAA